MRCPDCQKFVSLETDEPEADLTVEMADDNKTAQIAGTVTLRRNCAECGTQLKEAVLDVDETVDFETAKIDPKAEVEVEIDVTSIENTESGGGRYKKNMIGYELTYMVTATWKLGKEEGTDEIEGTLEDFTPASAFDEVV